MLVKAITLFILLSFSLLGHAKKVLYKWPKPGFNHSGYVVEIYKDEIMSDLIKKEKVSENKIEIDVESDFFIRVAIVSTDGEVSEFSNLSKVIYDPRELKLLNPSQDKSFKIKPNGVQLVDFEWDYLENKNCTLVITKRSAEELNESDQRNEYQVTGLKRQISLAEGTYEWSVNCKDGPKTLDTESRIIYVQTTKVKKAKKKKVPPYHLLAFYTASLGEFNEVAKSNNTEVVHNQNSPVTLGLQGFYNIDKWTRWSASIYFSYLTTSERNDNSRETTDPPLEIGMNAYYYLTLKSLPKLPFHLGLDIEKFNSFNAEQLSSTSTTPTSFRDQILAFITLGASYTADIFDKAVNFKLALSQSVFSTGDENPVSGDTYSGQKIIFFTRVPFTQRWGIHFFYKVHILSGPGDLDINRYGLGVDYTFF